MRTDDPYTWDDWNSDLVLLREIALTLNEDEDYTVSLEIASDKVLIAFLQTPIAEVTLEAGRIVVSTQGSEAEFTHADEAVDFILNQ
jgi:hypothetical protein